MEWLLMLSKFMVIWTKLSYVSWPADPPVQTRAYCRPACVHLDPSESDSIFLWQPPLCAPPPPGNVRTHFCQLCATRQARAWALDLDLDKTKLTEFCLATTFQSQQ